MNEINCFNKTYCSLEVLQLDQLANSSFFHLQLQSPHWDWRPGQFVMLRPESWTYDPFISRPFSIANQDQKVLHIYWQVVGKGTQKLTQLKKGDHVIVWGPLGIGFKQYTESPTLLLAGGMGIVPFVGLVLNHPRPENVEMIFGHRHALENYPFDLLSEKILAWNVQDKTNEDLKKLEKAIRVKIRGYSEDGYILACGPLPFLKMVQNISLCYKAKTQISLETYMACGVGACMGCVVLNKQNEYVQTCTQGPVFWVEDVQL